VNPCVCLNLVCGGFGMPRGSSRSLGGCTVVSGRHAPLSRTRKAVVTLLLGACTYGPPRLEVRITNHVFASAAPLAAFAVYAVWLQSPTGVSTFPDGGRPRILMEAAAVYTCDTVTLAVHRVWRADRPESIRSGFAPWLGPWPREGLFVSLRGYGSTTSEPATFRRLNYRLDPDGTVEPGVIEPERGIATSQPAQCIAPVLAAARADPPAHWPQ